MKKHIGILSISVLLLGGLTACNDFLDREPLDKVTPEVFFSSEDDLASYTINCYSFQTVTSAYGSNLFGVDSHTDNQAGTGIPAYWIPGQKQVAANVGGWKWEGIRACNYFFDNVLPKEGDIVGAPGNIRHYIGEMYVLRAYKYFDMLKTFGDLPIIDKALPDDREILLKASVRRPRHKVAEFIINDLKEAEKRLLETPPGGKNRISRNVAYLLHSRVALYEATWEKYHAGTAFVPGGKGWPGKDSEGYDAAKSIAYFLDEAIAAAQVVGDKMVDKLAKNTETPEGMDVNLSSINPYYTMFCDENMEGYEEVLMWKKFDLGLGIVNNLQMELCRNGAGTGWTRGMVNSFLMKNGLPIYASKSGYDKKWEDQGVNATLKDRDSRIVIFTKKPYDFEAEKYGMNGNRYVSASGKVLAKGDVNYYTSAGKEDTCKIDYIFGTNIAMAPTGYIVKKGKHYSYLMALNHANGTSGGIVFRGAEALLNYMEAYYEKHTSLDERAKRYWKALRTRAGIKEDYMVTNAATKMEEEAKGDWAAYSHGKLLSDVTLYNIRRERRNELCAEAFRWDDLKRWRAMDQLCDHPYVIEGAKFWGTIYNNNKALMEKCIVDAAKGNMSSKDLSDYICPYQKVTANNSIAKQGGFLFSKAQYLEPIGAAAFRQTAVDPDNFSSSVIYQNPGWKIEASTGAQPVE